MMNDDLDRVVPLDQLDDFKVAEGDPDVRGWEVVASDGRKIGEVDQLLVDTAAMKVRYLDVDVDNDLVAGATDASDRHVLIPIGYARLDEASDRVIVDQLASSDVVGLPEYTHGPITRDFESSVRSRFDAGYTATGTAATAGAAGLASTETTETPRDTDNDFYSHDLYDDNRFYGARRGLEGSESPPPLSGADRSLGEQRLGGGTTSSDSSLNADSSMRSDSSLRGDAPLHSGTSMNSEPSLRGDSSPSEDPSLRGDSSLGGGSSLHSDTRGEDPLLRDERRDDRL